MFNYTKKIQGSFGEKTVPNIQKIIVHVLILIAVLAVILGSVGSIEAGKKGIVLNAGAVSGRILNPGLYFKVPLYQQVVKMDIQTQKEQTDASAASSDLQTVHSTIALNYSVDPNKIGTLYQDVGADYKSRIIDPAIQESVKASTAKFTAEQLITHRDEVSADIKQALVTRLQQNGIKVEQFSVINFDFSKSFNDAIEAKVTAEQNALAAKNKLSQVEYEAQQAVEEAKGKAEALRVESAAIASNPSIIQLRAIEKWDGKLPSTTGGAIPFLNIKGN